MKVSTALAVVLAVNVMLFLGQLGVSAIAQDELNNTGSIFYTYDGSLMSDFDTGSNYTLNQDIASKLPDNEGSISPETGSFFTDMFSTMKNWFLETTGFKYVFAIVNAVPNFLKIIIPIQEVSFALGFFWHVLTLFLVVSFIRGGGQL